MDERLLQRLEDILEAIERIGVLTVHMDEVNYCREDNWPVRAAVERLVIIAAEALIWVRHHESQVFADIRDGPRAISLRNVIVHQYQHVDDEVIWQTIAECLPELSVQVGAMLTTQKDEL